MLTIIANILKAFNSILPDSPVRGLVLKVPMKYIQYINYFVPFDIARDITLTWTISIAAYYLYKLVKRIIMKYIIGLIINVSGS